MTTNEPTTEALANYAETCKARIPAQMKLIATRLREQAATIAKLDGQIDKENILRDTVQEARRIIDTLECDRERLVEAAQCVFAFFDANKPIVQGQQEALHPLRHAVDEAMGKN